MMFTHPNLPCPPPPPQPLDIDPVSLSTPQHNPTVVCQPAVKEEESHLEESREQPLQQPSQPPVLKVKMSLCDLVLRKKKQREEEIFMNHDTPSSAGMDLPLGRSEGGVQMNGIRVDSKRLENCIMRKEWKRRKI